VWLPGGEKIWRYDYSLWRHHSSSSTPNVMAIFRRGPPPVTGASNAGKVWKNRDLSQYLAPSRAVNAATARCYQHGAAGLRQVVTFIAGSSKRRSLLMAGDDYEMFMTRSFNVTPKTTEQYLIVRSDKSVAYVTDNKRLCSTFCTIEANDWQTRSIARPLCDSRATCLVLDYEQ